MNFQILNNHHNLDFKINEEKSTLTYSTSNSIWSAALKVEINSQLIRNNEHLFNKILGDDK